MKQAINQKAGKAAPTKTQADIPQYDPATDPYAPIKALITKTEGTTKTDTKGNPINPYTTTLAYGHWLNGGKEVDLEKMTLSQLRVLAEQMWANQKAADRAKPRKPGEVFDENKKYSSAMGKYQMTVTNMLKHAEAMGLDPDKTYFNRDTQEAIQNHWLASTGLRPGNEKNFNKVWGEVSKQWESIGNSSGAKTIGASTGKPVNSAQHEKEREALAATFTKLNGVEFKAPSPANSSSKPPEPTNTTAAPNQSTSKVKPLVDTANEPATSPVKGSADSAIRDSENAEAKTFAQQERVKESAIRDAENAAAVQGENPEQPSTARPNKNQACHVPEQDHQAPEI